MTAPTGSSPLQPGSWDIPNYSNDNLSDSTKDKGSIASKDSEGVTLNSSSDSPIQENPEDLTSKIKSFAKGLFNIIKEEKKGVTLLGGATALLGLGAVTVAAGVLTASAPLWIIGAATISAIALPTIVSLGIFYFAREKTVAGPDLAGPPPKYEPKKVDDNEDDDEIKQTPEPENMPPINDLETMEKNPIKKAPRKEEDMMPPFFEEDLPQAQDISQKDLSDNKPIRKPISSADEDIDLEDDLNDKLTSSVNQLQDSFENLGKTLESLANEEEITNAEENFNEEVTKNIKSKKNEGTKITFFDPLGDLFNPPKDKNIK